MLLGPISNTKTRFCTDCTSNDMCLQNKELRPKNISSVIFNNFTINHLKKT